LSALKPGAVALADAGHALLTARQYSAAKNLLAQPGVAESSPSATLDLAIAMFHAAGNSATAIAALEQGLKAEPERVDSYWQAAVLMSANHREADLFTLLDRAARTLPAEPQIPVIEAAFLELSGKTEDAQRTLSGAQRRWPEVASIWVAQGIILAAHDHLDAARKAFETAVALGAHGTEPDYSALGEKLFVTTPPGNW
jgi:tetratricopeptide (TPR) repeat protein